MKVKLKLSNEKGCVHFPYKGYTISLSNVLHPYDTTVWKGDSASEEPFLISYPTTDIYSLKLAINFIDKLKQDETQNPPPIF